MSYIKTENYEWANKRGCYNGSYLKCPVCGGLYAARGGMTQHMASHIKNGEVELLEVPRTEYDRYVVLPDGRRFNA